jgi:hypothetical protein
MQSYLSICENSRVVLSAMCNDKSKVEEEAPVLENVTYLEV